jgi:hypothetical protein
MTIKTIAAQQNTVVAMEQRQVCRRLLLYIQL